jgi:hypothetical protein
MALAVPLLFLAACSSTPSASDANAAACSALATFSVTLKAFEALGPAATVGQYKDAAQAVSTAWAGVEAAMVTVKDAKIDEVKTAAESLQSTIQSMPDSTTAVDASMQVKAGVTGVTAAVQNLNNTLKCPVMP